MIHGAADPADHKVLAIASAGSAYRQRGVHLSERFIDDHFSIVIGDASDGIVYLHAAPLHVSVSPIHSQLFNFFVPRRLGIIVGHFVKSSPPNLVTVVPPARAQNNLPALSGKQSLLLSLIGKVERKPSLQRPLTGLAASLSAARCRHA
jgi:hypothetical protein